MPTLVRRSGSLVRVLSSGLLSTSCSGTSAPVNCTHCNTTPASVTFTAASVTDNTGVCQGITLQSSYKWDWDTGSSFNGTWTCAQSDPSLATPCFYQYMTGRILRYREYGAPGATCTGSLVKDSLWELQAFVNFGASSLEGGLQLVFVSGSSGGAQGSGKQVSCTATVSSPYSCTATRSGITNSIASTHKPGGGGTGDIN